MMTIPTKTIIRVIIVGLIFAGSFLGTEMYIKSIVTKLILNEFRYHFGAAQFYTIKGLPEKVLPHYLHGLMWAQRYETIINYKGRKR